MILARLLEPVIREGRLTIVDATGRRHVLEGGPGPSVTLRLHDPSLHWKLVVDPELHLGEAYMDGTATVEDGSLYDLLDLMGRNQGAASAHAVAGTKARLDRLFRRLHQYNPVDRARANVAHHYDLSRTFYDLFLDADRQYSCAYFAAGDEDLEQAQELKKRHIAAKLLVEPGHRVLDIGCGWGGLGLYLARATGAEVTGITLSEEQLKVAQGRASEAGIADRLRFALRDYRHERGTYDRIVSVGMFEHVGVGHFREFFANVRDMLADGGVALLHTIGRMEPPGTTNPWIRKYIFPGGYIPALSEVVAAIEREGLWVTDVEVLRLHYAETLRHWRQRFTANWARAAELYDERFCRMWEFYLAGSEVAFRHMRKVVFQIQLSRRQDAVPLVRNYIESWEQAAAEAGGPGRHRAA